jgi:predicted phosphodiesterase
MIMNRNERFAEAYNNVTAYPKLRHVAEALGLQIKTVKNKATELRKTGLELIDRKALAARQGKLGFNPVLHGFQIASTAVRMDEAGRVTETRVRQRPAPGPKYKLPENFAIDAISTLTDGEGNTIAEWKKAKREKAVAEDLLDAVQAVLKTYTGIAAQIPAPLVSVSDMLTAYPIADLHLGMLSWGRETKDPYDLKIAEARLRTMAGDLIDQSKPTEEALILGLGDLFHVNDSKNETPASKHHLDADGRWGKIYQTGLRVIMDMVELALQKHRIVRVRILPGNHDEDAAVILTASLAVIYANNPRVIVVDDPSLLFSMRFGKVLLGATHGHTMKPERMAMSLAVDCPKEWGETSFRHFFYGHYHHQRAQEIGGVLTECFRTIAGKDAYSHGGGYRSGKTLTAITFHKERGETGRHFVNLV